MCDSLRHFSHFSRKLFGILQPLTDASTVDNTPHVHQLTPHIDNTDKIHYNIWMKPTTAYSLLKADEQHIVDDYVQYAINEQHRKRERIIHALSFPIPTEYVRRSKGVIHKPLILAAVAEKLREAADEQDISPSRVIAEHASIAFSSLSDYIQPTGFGTFAVKDLVDIPHDKMGAVKSIETKPGMYGMATKVVLHDKHPSLKAMAEMMGLVAPDKVAPLLEYVKPPAAVEDKAVDISEQVYIELLETV